MNCITAFCLVIIVAAAGCSPAEPEATPRSENLANTARTEPPSIPIPINQIWAYNMPGTRKMSDSLRGRPPDYESAEGPLLSEIRQALSRSSDDKDASPGFAVVGTDIEALREACAVIVDEKQPTKSFPTGSDVTAVFFSYTYGQYVHIEKVERQGNSIEITFRFVPHVTLNVSEHFALIPLGKLPAGEYHVSVTQSPMPDKFVKEGYPVLNPEMTRRVVSRPFSFSIEP